MASTKERIVEAATVLAIKYGLLKIQIQEIADYIGISKKTVYNNFDSKQDILEAVLESNYNEVISRLDAIIENTELSFPERMRNLFKQIISEFTEKENLFFDSFSELSQSIRDKYTPRLRGQILSKAERLIEEGIDGNNLRQDINIDFIPHFYLILIEGMFRLYSDYSFDLKPVELIRETLMLSWSGILSEEGLEILNPHKQISTKRKSTQ